MKIIRKIKINLIQFKYGLINLYNWFRVIWSDRDWDFYFIYAVLERKLDLMIKSGFYTHQRNRELKIAHELLKRIKCDYYSNEILDIISYSLNCDNLNCIIVKDIGNVEKEKYFAKYKRTVNKVRKEEHDADDDIIMMLVAEKIQNKAMTLFFKILNEKIELWWD